MEEFFEQMGVKTRLGDYGLGAKDVDAVLAVLEKHRMVKLGEKRDVTLAVTRKVLEMSL
jgi:NADP-dependent alcohol dehydrogenase